VKRSRLLPDFPIPIRGSCWHRTRYSVPTHHTSGARIDRFTFTRRIQVGLLRCPYCCTILPLVARGAFRSLQPLHQKRRPVSETAHWRKRWARAGWAEYLIIPPCYLCHLLPASGRAASKTRRVPPHRRKNTEHTTGRDTYQLGTGPRRRASH
jgi:hypothetical protein